MIRFRYQPAFKDYFALNRIVAWRQLRILTVIGGILLVIYLIQPFIISHVGSAWNMYRSSWTVLILPGLVGFLFFSTYLAVRKRWKGAEEIRIDREYEIDETGVRVTGSSLSGFLEWRHFIRADCLSGYFILKTAQNQYHYFPASAVPDRQALVALLKSKVSNANHAKPSKRRWLLFTIWFGIIFVVIVLYYSNPSAP